MPLFEIRSDSLAPLETTTYAASGLYERGDLQRLLKANISAVLSDVLVIAEEFGDWEGSYRRIDLLGIDRDANLVVIELKRTEDGGHMELQALRYAAMVSTMRFDEVVLTACFAQTEGKPQVHAQRYLGSWGGMNRVMHLLAT
jgi:RecB family endonuclease NucS